MTAGHSTECSWETVTQVLTVQVPTGLQSKPASPGEAASSSASSLCQGTPREVPACVCSLSLAGAATIHTHAHAKPSTPWAHELPAGQCLAQSTCQEGGKGGGGVWTCPRAYQPSGRAQRLCCRLLLRALVGLSLLLVLRRQLLCLHPAPVCGMPRQPTPTPCCAQGGMFLGISQLQAAAVLAAGLASFGSTPAADKLPAGLRRPAPPRTPLPGQRGAMASRCSEGSQTPAPLLSSALSPVALSAAAQVQEYECILKAKLLTWI